MDHLWKSCSQYFQTDDAKRQMKSAVLNPLGGILYEEFYIYVWIICFYHVFLILLVFSIFLLLLRQIKSTSISPYVLPVQSVTQPAMMMI